MKTTCLHSRHTALGAMMSPFAGFDMPISYRGIEEEHMAVRTCAGVFDVSHMGEVTVIGRDATAFVNRIFTGDVSSLKPGQVIYGMMLNHDGGIVDDLLVYKDSDTQYLLVINASNIEKDVAWIESCLDGSFEVTAVNASDSWSELALQGPKAESVLREVLGLDMSELPFYHFRRTDIEGKEVIVSRTGYTGEDGFEIYACASLITQLWDKLMDAGVEPCGLGCRDTLRFEAGLPLYGNELSDTVTPLEASLSMFAKLEKPDFIGREAIVAQKVAGVPRKSVGLEIDGRAIARHGCTVLDAAGREVGEVTTGYLSISLDKSIAMALVDASCAAPGTKLQVQIRRKVFPATVVKKRFYTPNYHK